MKKILILLILVISGFQFAQAQVLDQVVAIVGGKIVKLSDIENQFQQAKLQGVLLGEKDKCQILENLMVSKLLINQAELDSIVVDDQQIESEMDRRLRYYIAQFGSRDKFEEFYKKSILEFKNEFREIIRGQKMEQEMEGKITGSVTVTPSDVKKYFNSQDPDSIPLVPAEYEIGQIVRQPKIGQDEKEKVRQKLTELRDRILKGENFASLAVLYSEDPGSAKKGGELGSHGRGEFYPEFEAMSFSLQKDEISPIVETKAGFHILQLIDRKGDYVNVRHILIMPKVSVYDLANAKNFLDSVYTLIKEKKITIEEAAAKFSDDPSGKNGGMMINSASGNSRFSAEELDPSVYFVADKLQQGEVSQAVPMKDEEGKQAYRLLYLKLRTSPHKANLKDDYDKIQNATYEKAKQDALNKWIGEKIKTTYVKIFDEYKKCSFQQNWFAN
jgi:peptidyl-prolyl cis-trans isomerase SurA